MVQWVHCGCTTHAHWLMFSVQLLLTGCDTVLLVICLIHKHPCVKNYCLEIHLYELFPFLCIIGKPCWVRAKVLDWSSSWLPFGGSRCRQPGIMDCFSNRRCTFCRHAWVHCLRVDDTAGQQDWWHWPPFCHCQDHWNQQRPCQGGQHML